MTKYSDSKIDVGKAKSVLDSSVDIINEMMVKQKGFKNEIAVIVNNWKGGGKGRNNALLRALNASNSMYNDMSLVVLYAMQMIAAIKIAGNTLYKSYTGENENLFE